MTPKLQIQSGAAEPGKQAAEVLKAYDERKSRDEYWFTWMQEIMEHCLPRRAYITYEEVTPTGTDYDQIWDTTAIESCQGLAQMMTAQLTPVGQNWVRWLPPHDLEDDEEVVSWFEDASEQALKILHRTNFYEVRHELNLDIAGPGTGAMSLMPGRNNLFNFSHLALGHFVFEEDEEGMPERMWREYPRTARQLVAEFPQAKELCPKVRDALQQDKPTLFHVVHEVTPREEYDPRKQDQQNMPWASCYVVREDKVVVSEGGFHEFPFMVSRFMKWGTEGTVWGVSPARKAMPAIHQAHFLQEMMDELAEIAVRPRFIAPADLVGEIDLRAGGRTLASPTVLNNPNSLREWMTQGRYDIGLDRIREKQEAIRRLFFHELWSDSLDQDLKAGKQMTATEFAGRERRQQERFVPAMARHSMDMGPVHRRMFGMLLRANRLGEMPPALVEYAQDLGELPDPYPVYQTRLTSVLERVRLEGFDRFFERLLGAAQLDPTLVDEIDLQASIREVARWEGIEERFIRPEDEVIEIAQARAAQAARQETLQAAQGAAEVANKLGVQAPAPVS